MQSLKDLLKRFPIEIDTAKVISVEDDSCHVESLTTGNDFFDCSMNSLIENKENRLLITPKIGSVVTIGIYSVNNLAVIIAVSEVEKIYFKNEKADFTFDSNGFEFNRDGENLKNVINDFQDGFGKLCDELSKVVVSIGVTPDVPAIKKIKTEIITQNKNALNKILK
ncbi:hypothetical protein [Chryseobacterium sp.]|uniref:hypothetical protein n=1 Tax=Chryseobacterium sp. TaxID=1871047 RepID=UPI00289B1317|nr:hypothetical protein [Chryseobacterium sp.]